MLVCYAWRLLSSLGWNDIYTCVCVMNIVAVMGSVSTVDCYSSEGVSSSGRSEGGVRSVGGEGVRGRAGRPTAADPPIWLSSSSSSYCSSSSSSSSSCSCVNSPICRQKSNQLLLLLLQYCGEDAGESRRASATSCNVAGATCLWSETLVFSSVPTSHSSCTFVVCVDTSYSKEHRCLIVSLTLQPRLRCPVVYIHFTTRPS